MAAYIDLKNCRFFIEDGWSDSGAVNHTAGYSIGATAIVVDLFTDELVPGNILTFSGHATVYTLVSETPTSSVTTGIVISPPLTASVADDEVITVGPHVLEVTMGEGNLTFDEKRALEYKLNRGLLDQVRLGDQAPVDVNFSFAWTFLSSPSGGTIPTVEEFFRKTGPAALFKTTGSDCEPYAVNIILEQTQPCASDSSAIERITLPQFRHTSLNHDPKAGTVTAQGTCNTTVAIRERLTSSKDHD